METTYLDVKYTCKIQSPDYFSFICTKTAAEPGLRFDRLNTFIQVIKRINHVKFQMVLQSAENNFSSLSAFGCIEIDPDPAGLE